jgi:hypothetical protein
MNWKESNEECLALARADAAMDLQIGEALRRARELRVHEQVGCGSFFEYSERVFGYGRRTTEERLRVAEELDRLPAIRAALARGDIRWSAAREMTRVAMPANEEKWLAHCQDMTVRQIEEEVARHDEGADPGDRRADVPETRDLRVTLSAETWATLQDALELLRCDGCESEDDAFLELGRRTLEGPTDEGRASYQIAFTVCDRCAKAEQHAKGRGVAVDDAVLEMAACDAQWLGSTDAPTRAHQDTPPLVRRMVYHRDKGRCVVPGCRARRFLDVHHLVFQEDGGKHTMDNLCLLCAGHHRALHRGTLRASGKAGDLRFERGTMAHVSVAGGPRGSAGGAREGVAEGVEGR